MWGERLKTPKIGRSLIPAVLLNQSLEIISCYYATFQSNIVLDTEAGETEANMKNDLDYDANVKLMTSFPSVLIWVWLFVTHKHRSSALKNYKIYKLLILLPFITL